MLWPAVLLVAVGLLNGGLGYLIWRRNVYGLIAGYDARRPPPNPERLARWIGKWSVALGVTCLAAGIGVGVFPVHVGAIVRTMAVMVIAIVAVTIIGALRRSR